MSNDVENDLQKSTITLESEDGESYECEIIDIFDFKGKDYALLLKPGEQGAADGEEETSLVIMRVIMTAEQSIFQHIEDDDEWSSVSEYMESRIRASQEDEEDE